MLKIISSKVAARKTIKAKLQKEIPPINDEGMKKDEVIERLSGIRCGFKRTSCPDQLAKALSESE